MSILAVDDDQSILKALQLLLNSEGIQCSTCSSPEEALDYVQRFPCELALIDLNYVDDTTSGREGLALISSLLAIREDLPIIAMTGWGTVEIAVEAMRLGAADFIEKPWDNHRLLSIIRTQLKMEAVQGRERRLRSKSALLQRSGTVGELVSRAPEMTRLLSKARRVAQSGIPIVITGENGTGKSLLARYLHEHSLCAEGPFISVNMGALAESTFESEMFGHTRGAFTDAKGDRVGRVELADQGTLFMDEIANMPLAQQAKILRLAEERRYERLGNSESRSAQVRFISATNANLEVMVADRSFRQDLFYRLNGVTLHIPPLRDRKADIPLLAERFLTRARERYQSPAVSFTDAARAALEHYAWPGNIRELQHVVERTSLLAENPVIGERDLELAPSAASEQVSLDDDVDQLSLEQAEVWLIRRALSRHGGNAVSAAKALGISRSALYRRLGKKEPA